MCFVAQHGVGHLRLGLVSQFVQLIDVLARRCLRIVSKYRQYGRFAKGKCMVHIFDQDVTGDGTFQQDGLGIGAPSIDEGMWFVQRLQADAWHWEIGAVLTEEIPSRQYAKKFYQYLSRLIKKESMKQYPTG